MEVRELGIWLYLVVSLGLNAKAHDETRRLRNASMRVFHFVLRLIHVHAHDGLVVAPLSSWWLTDRRWHEWWRGEVIADWADLLNVLVLHPGVTHWKSDFDRLLLRICFLIGKANELIVGIEAQIIGLLLLMTTPGNT